MTIQKAIKSGRPFTHKDVDFWITTFQNNFFIHSFKLPQITTATTAYFQISMKQTKKNKWQKIDSDWRDEGDEREKELPIMVRITVSSTNRTDWEIKP